MTQPSSLSDSPGSNSSRRRHRPRTSLRVRNVADGVAYHLVFEGDVRRLSGQQLRHHLASICHIPPAEQQLFVHGAAFSTDALGAAVGLRQEDTVDLVRRDGGSGATTAAAEEAASPPPSAQPVPKERHPRGHSAATASSMRPSTDAGTLSPEAPYTHPSHREANAYYPTSGANPHRTTTTSRAAPAASSMGSTATTNTRIAPSPERLIAQRPRPPPPPSQRSGESGRRPVATKPVSHPYPPPPQRPPYYEGDAQEDSQLPLWTSATTLSSFPTGYRDEEGGGSPRPHVPFRGAAPPQRPWSAEPSQLDSSTHYGSNHHRPSYEVPSPYAPQRQRQLQGHPHYSASSSAPPPQPLRQPYSARNGLNQSRMERASGGSRSQPRRASPGASSALDPGVQTPPTRVVAVRADDLETLLEEQDYIWQMEEYRFRTERLNRLSALQSRQRELTFEAARYDQAVAVVSSQLQRERRKLTELQETMSHHTASLHRLNKRSEASHASRLGNGGDGGREDNDGGDDASEVIEVDV